MAEEESISSLSESEGEVPDLNTLLLCDHILPAENHVNSVDNEEISPQEGHDKRHTDGVHNVNGENGGNSNSNKKVKVQAWPNLLSKSLLAQIQRKDRKDRSREDPLRHMKLYRRQQKSEDKQLRNSNNKSIVVITIKYMRQKGGGERIGSGGSSSYLDSSYGYESAPKTANEWEEYYAKQRVNKAFEHVQKVNSQRKEQQLSGMPTNAFQVMADEEGPQLHVVKEIKASVYNRRKRAALAAKKREEGLDLVKEQVESKNTKKESSSSHSKLAKLPHGFAFPKEENFIREKTKIEKIGVDWQMHFGDVPLLPSSGDNNSTVSSQSSQSTPGKFHPPRPRHHPTAAPAPTSSSSSSQLHSTIPGRLCRTSYPVTEALHRHGTSITKLKGKTLHQPGDMNVSKVWPRKLDINGPSNVTPIQMAYEDMKRSEGFIFKVSVEKRILQH